MAKRKYPSYRKTHVKGHIRRVHTRSGVRRVAIKPHKSTIGRRKRRK